MAVDRRLVLALALSADCDVRTARRALVEGVSCIRTTSIRERLAAALATLAPERTRSGAPDEKPKP